ncbi:MAG: hydrogenase 3 maturation endopeptidase HyCI [Candidatus Aenigmarchaeota archaeon]|nr:hydrogenase 3 maturation endopeptidase HyCI [Candidatus Aenigmarchaeota archaeon]
MILILGVGNEMRGDDAFGPLVVEKLREISNQNSITIWSGDTPENFIGKIKERVEKLIIMDTAYLGKEPGTVELLEPERITKQAVSTHKIPLSLIIDQLKPEKTYFIAAQPKAVEFGTEPSKEILKAVEKAIEMVKDMINQ